MNVIALRNYPGLRQWIQVVAAAVVAAAVSYNKATPSQAALWLALVAAVLPPALSAFNSANGRRTIIYGAVGAIQALVLAYDLATPDQVEPIVNIILAGIGGGVAVTHTPTPAGAQRPDVTPAQ